MLRWLASSAVDGMKKTGQKKTVAEPSKAGHSRQKRIGRPPGNEPPKRKAILDAALYAFAHHGVDRVNLRQIATVADVNVSLIVHQFGSKMGLWKEVVDLVGGIMQHAAMDAIDERIPMQDEERLQRAIDYLVDSACNIPERGLLLIQDIGHAGERFDYLLARLIKPTRDLLLPVIQKVVASKTTHTEPAPVDPEFLTFILAGSISTAIAMRPLIARFTSSAIEDESFRQHLKAALRISFVPPLK